MKKLMFGLLLIFCFISTNAQAELLYKELQHSYEKLDGESAQVLDNYLIGLYEGINAANLAYFMQSKQFLVCKPQSIDLNAKDLKRIIDDSHKSFNQNNDIPVSYLLFVGLRKTFPCL